MSVTVTHLLADEVFLGSDGEGRGDEYWLDGKPAPIEVGYQDGRIRIGVVTEAGMSEDAGLYFTPARADELVRALKNAIAIAEEEGEA